MGVDIIKLRFVAGEIACLEYSLTQAIEQLEVTGQEEQARIFHDMLDKVKTASRERV